MRILGPDVVDEMIAQVHRSIVSCVICGHQFSCNEGEELAIDCGIESTLAMCPGCGAICSAGAAPSEAAITADVV